MKNKNIWLNRGLSLLLVFMMIFSMMPMSTFAVGNNSESENQDTNEMSGDTYLVKATKFFGWRFSLYFAEGVNNEADITSSTEFVPLGQIETNILMSIYPPTYWTGLNVYNRMGYANDIGMNETRLSKVDYKSKITTTSDLPILSSIPKVYEDGVVKKGDLNKFFMGTADYDFDNPTDEQKKNLDFKNTITIANYILAQNNLGKIPYDKSKDIDGYRDGCYIDGDDVTHRGVLKLHYEPILNYKIKGKYFAMSLRDIITYINAHPDYNLVKNGSDGYYGYIPSGVLMQGKMVYLVRPEPHLRNMGTASTDFGDSKKNVYNMIQSGGKLYLNGGVGVVTGGIYNTETPELIKTYVEITRIDPDGTVHFKKAAESTKENIEFYKDVNNNLTSFPLFEDIDNSEDTRVAVLNDVFTTPYDLTVDNKTEWVDTELIKNVGKDLKADSEDIAGYKFGLVTDSQLFIDSFEKHNVVNDNLTSSYLALKDYLEAVVGQNAGFASESFKLLGNGDTTTIDSVANAVIYTHHMSEESNLVRLTNDELEEFDKSPEFSLVRAGIVDEESGEVVKMTEEYMEMLKAQYGTEVGLTTPANTVVLRYIVKPNPSQVNVIKVMQREADGSLTPKEVIVENPIDLDIIGSTVNIQEPITQLPGKIEEGPTLKEWVTNSEYPVLELPNGELPNMSDNGKTGTTNAPITNYPLTPLTHNLYVEWEVILGYTPPVPGNEDVPEWRLSKYISSISAKANGTADANMWFTLGQDRGHAGTSLSPSGTYNYKLVNANGRISNGGNNPANMNMITIGTVPSGLSSCYSGVQANTWFHSKTYTSDSDSISHDDTRADMTLDGTLNMIKSKDSASIVAANWITNNVNGLDAYSITNGTKPLGYSGLDVYKKDADLRLGIYNSNTYTHKKSNYRHIPLLIGSICICYQSTETFGPSSVNYETANYDFDVTFDRYIQKNTDAKKLLVEPEVTNENGLTSIKYQLTDTLNIYPEYGMLFDDDAGKASIKWMVGDQARKVSPVVWQTLQHKVYVVPNSNGTSYATDSRAITQASALGEARKQVIYKGAGVNTAFQLYKDNVKNSKGILTVKTFALDFDKNANVKAAWGDGSYNSYTQHQALLNSINTKKTATASEKLLVDSPTFGNVDYTGAIKNLTTGTYNLIKYSGKDYVEFEHKLIVRGGALIGIVMNNRNGGTELLTPEQLKTKDESLYNAIVGMNLYNESGDRSKTIFSTFEYQTGKALTESSYASLLASARKSIDKMDTPSSSAISVGKGWYSEDTTVLVIKEYVSNYEVPSISFGDKLSMSVKGLDTPIDKAQFFKAMGKGYTYLRYDLKLSNPYPTVSNLPEINSFFEFSSFSGLDLKYKPSSLSKGTVFGQQSVDYLVPNVSVSDTTRLS